MQRQTAQRQAILGVLQSSSGPLTPQEVLELAQEKHPGLGLATVYRNLNTLETEGDIVAVYIPGESCRYEIKRGHLHHFCCQVCERVFDFNEVCPLELLDNSRLPSGFFVTNHRLTLYGVCPECQ
ncbi:MAG: Fur family transcriptional regulator [Trueperaceae bacterium]